ncbi:hypothetical protein [Neorhizobium galegae]|uniref:hypothetical protein n=1 Tax=Neorhizobium galegae TaxID=399 RepID=UPI00062762F2|nr:hypothetical protein [Neorhizobium galegae]
MTSELKYLICLHNEQNEALRRQADVVRMLAQELDRRDTAVTMMQQQVGRLQNRLMLLEIAARQTAP